nr:hypothetical protein [Tanacetum cinerariifolium]
IPDSKGAIPSKTAADAKVAIQEMAKYSQKWHNGTYRIRSTETSDRLASIQAQLNNLGREIKKVNDKVYAAQVGCEQCKGPHYTKDFPIKEEGKTLEEAYYSQFGIDNDIYSTVDACHNACEMWKSIERLKQGTTVVQKSRIQCYNCKEFRHVARECQKPKRVKDIAYHKEKMLLHKQEEAGFQLNAEQADWRDDTDDEPEDQELEAHYMHVARECQKPKRAKDAAYHKEKMLLCKQEEARIQLNAKQANWRHDTDDDELEDQELEAHYMYMAQLQEVS